MRDFSDFGAATTGSTLIASVEAFLGFFFFLCFDEAGFGDLVGLGLTWIAFASQCLFVLGSCCVGASSSSLTTIGLRTIGLLPSLELKKVVIR